MESHTFIIVTRHDPDDIADGTFWSKNVFLRSRKIKVMRGFLSLLELAIGNSIFE